MLLSCKGVVCSGHTTCDRRKGPHASGSSHKKGLVCRQMDKVTNSDQTTSRSAQRVRHKAFSFSFLLGHTLGTNAPQTTMRGNLEGRAQRSRNEGYMQHWLSKQRTSQAESQVTKPVHHDNLICFLGHLAGRPGRVYTNSPGSASSATDKAVNQ